MDERTPGALLERGDRFEDVLLGLRLDLRQLPEAMIFRGLLELVDGRDLQVLVDDPRRGRPDARDAQQRDESLGYRRFQLCVPLRLAVADQLGDRFGHRRSGLRDLGEAALLEQDGHGLAQIADRARDLTVGHRTEDVLPLELEEVTDLVEDRGDAFVVERGGSPGHTSMLAGYLINVSSSAAVISASII